MRKQKRAPLSTFPPPHDPCHRDAKVIGLRNFHKRIQSDRISHLVPFGHSTRKVLMLLESTMHLLQQ